MSISEFLERNYRHFNARETLAAAQAYREHLDSGGKMLLSLAGAMSTAEIGISLAPLIRSGKVHAISCTAANLEEDLYNLIAHRDYKMVPGYRDLCSLPFRLQPMFCFVFYSIESSARRAADGTFINGRWIPFLLIEPSRSVVLVFI